jgi:hypothetical protein
VHHFRGLLHRFFLPAVLALALGWPSHLLGRQRHPQTGLGLSVASLCLLEFHLAMEMGRREMWR